ncbi:MAG: 8-oxoguanine DNA glycosylase [Firmicutes bacterium]|nr:8-oxoguanine DNA glycosylase [Bacillota bacterium]
MKLKCKDIDLEKTFTCGQCFRWKHRRDRDGFTGVAGKRAAHVRLDGENISIEEIGRAGGRNTGDSAAFWHNYFDLDRDYEAAKEYLRAHDKKIAPAIETGDGIRILRQDLWETIVSFIISQNNNIPRIEGCIENLAKLYGEPIAVIADDKGTENTINTLPSPETLSSLTADDLAPIRLGYRAPYLIKAAREYTELAPKLESGSLSAEEELALLLSLTGVGPKVASCISLFGLSRIESFPVDVWVKRVMHETYGLSENDARGMKKFAAEHFGPYGGLAQQYLFYHIRCQNM